MACADWTAKLDAYVDGELPPEEERALREHMLSCASCSAAAVERLRHKRAVQVAGQRFVARPEFRSQIMRQVQSRPAARVWRWIPALAAAAALVIAGAAWLSTSRTRNAEALISELTDQHVATLASANPVDVISSDRHTVKPWFAGKLPFSFNLPELQGSAFTLVGGRVAYLRQSPGAELLFRVRQHQISVFVFQDRDLGAAPAAVGAGRPTKFGVGSFSSNGLRYVLVGDVGSQDLDELARLLKDAA
jgi:anti-sigma factor RsiW